LVSFFVKYFELDQGFSIKIEVVSWHNSSVNFDEIFLLCFKKLNKNNQIISNFKKWNQFETKKTRGPDIFGQKNGSKE